MLLAQWLRRPETGWRQLCEMVPGLREYDQWPRAVEQVVLEMKYAGYIERQSRELDRFHRMEDKPIPSQFDFTAVPQLRAEAREQLQKIRPQTLGQAGRVSGIGTADLAVLLMYLEVPRAARSTSDGSE
jgi:tRNA uridine 5-carboxymethylaminomethyl modification enzyme